MTTDLMRYILLTKMFSFIIQDIMPINFLKEHLIDKVLKQHEGTYIHFNKHGLLNNVNIYWLTLYNNFDKLKKNTTVVSFKYSYQQYCLLFWCSFFAFHQTLLAQT